VAEVPNVFCICGRAGRYTSVASGLTTVTSTRALVAVGLRPRRRSRAYIPGVRSCTAWHGYIDSSTSAGHGRDDGAVRVQTVVLPGRMPPVGIGSLARRISPWSNGVGSSPKFVVLRQPPDRSNVTSLEPDGTQVRPSRPGIERRSARAAVEREGRVGRLQMDRHGQRGEGRWLWKPGPRRAESETRCGGVPGLDVTPARSPMPSPERSAKLRGYTWYTTAVRHQSRSLDGSA